MSTGWGAPDTEPTRLVLLRHGQTPLSVDKRFAGRGDVELTDEGHQQASAAARRIAAWPVDAVVSSPLSRCRDTAAHAAEQLGLPVEVDEGLVETDFGEWEAMTFAEARAADPGGVDRWVSDPQVGPPGGESFAQVAARVGAARDALLHRHRGRTVLVVSHVTPIKILVQQAMAAPLEALYRMHLDTACLSRVDCYADGPMVVRSLNDTAHLAWDSL
ncbi:histidine phosphatase family protein [Nocardiopsis sp. HNM0947]|uniref:Histidine phosphatase family protein n=1 Tax=Nocardiopsis coralli TaxID=2772213 RepID=A0ABR9P6Z8_9ACTN|nr:histidine phosphatase family protein [Nocardiopsis coralli]MBE2999618.1 histidine phosphatase family protein [Nocardiopsis coralli]